MLSGMVTSPVLVSALSLVIDTDLSPNNAFKLANWLWESNFALFPKEVTGDE
jgi:hypothetical protein